MAKRAFKRVDEHAVLEILKRIDGLLSRYENYFFDSLPALDWNKVIAARWHKDRGAGCFQALLHPQYAKSSDLKFIDEQVQAIDRNTAQFVRGLPANNALLTGARGTGKSSLIRAMLGKYADKGLRLIELEKKDLFDLPEIIDRVYGLPFRFLLFCDDLSFAATEHAYTSLKALLDGATPTEKGNVLVYATSNRRHLIPEQLRENLETEGEGEEIHPGEAVEEKLSLSERFGLWLSFHPFNQEQYLAIVDHWLNAHGVKINRQASIHQGALQWARARGSRSGRVAFQFARDFAGQYRLKSKR